MSPPHSRKTTSNRSLNKAKSLQSIPQSNNVQQLKAFPDIVRPQKETWEDVELIPTVEDIYQDSVSLMDIKYVMDIINWIRSLEQQRRLPKSFLCDSDAVVSPHMRAVLIDWVLQVQHYLGLHQTTLYLAVNIIDQYFKCRASISMNSLQLLSICAIFISCKMEERFAPKIKKLIHLTEDSYTVDDVLTMERKILYALEFNFNIADPLPFIRHCLQAAQLKNEITTNYVPSLLGAAAVYLARKILVKESAEWTRAMQYYSGYSEDDLHPVVFQMCNTLIELPNSKFQGARQKYASMSRYKGLSDLEEISPKAIKSLLQFL